jgi:hypothetical protein
MPRATVGQTVQAKIHDGIITGEVSRVSRNGVTIQAAKKVFTVDNKTMAIDTDETVIVQERAILEIEN